MSILHGKTETPEYRIWRGMKTRCLNPNHEKYAYYGGRGISIAAEWLASFPTFLADMGPRPSPKHTLDRIDPAKDYEPGNCRWATVAEQANNRRNNRAVTIGGETVNLTEACRRYGLSLNYAQRHLAKGKTPDDVFTGTPAAKEKLTEDAVRAIRADPGKYGHRQRLARQFGVSPSTISSVRRGDTWADV